MGGERERERECVCVCVLEWMGVCVFVCEPSLPIQTYSLLAIHSNFCFPQRGSFIHSGIFPGVGSIKLLGCVNIGFMALNLSKPSTKNVLKT